MTAVVLDERPRVIEAVRCYTVIEAGELLGTSDDFVYARIKDGSIPAFVDLASEGERPKRRIRADHLMAYIEAHTRSSV